MTAEMAVLTPDEVNFLANRWKKAVSAALGGGRGFSRSWQLPKIVFAHYRQLCTEAEAKDWFSIRPPRDEANVLQKSITGNCASRSKRHSSSHGHPYTNGEVLGQAGTLEISYNLNPHTRCVDARSSCSLLQGANRDRTLSPVERYQVTSPKSPCPDKQLDSLAQRKRLGSFLC
jgi:hypothetical protein